MSKLLELIRKIIIEFKIIIETKEPELEKAADILGRKYNIPSDTVLKMYKASNKK